MSIGEKQQDTSNVPQKNKVVKEKGSHDFQLDQSENLEQKDVTIETPSTMPKNWHLDERGRSTTNIYISMSILNWLRLLALVIVNKDGTKVHMGQGASPIPIPPSQGQV